MRCISILFLFLCIHARGFAQGSAAQYTEDTAVINQMIRGINIKGVSGGIVTAVSPDTAIREYKEVLRRSIRANHADGAFMALIEISIKYYEKEDYAEERASCLEALPWAAKSDIKDATAWCYNNIGDAYFGEGDYISSSEYQYRALEELKTHHVPPTHVTVNVYNALGMVNMRLGQPDKAFTYFDEAEAIERTQDMGFQLANTLTSKGEYYNSVHKPDMAVACFKEVMQVGERIKKRDLQAIAYAGLGKAFTEKKQYPDAITMLEHAIVLAGDVYPYIAVDAYCSLGDVQYHMAHYAEAETTLRLALDEARQHNYKDYYINCYTKLIAVYRASGAYDKALNYTDSIMVLRDSLTSSEKARTFNQMEIKYKTAEKDKQIARSQLLIAEQQNKIERKNVWIISVVAGIAVLALILGGLYRNARHKHRLQSEQIKSLQQENKIGVLKAVVQGEEKERTRIAGELHDGIGGMLSAAMMRFMSIRHDNEDVTKIEAYKEGINLLEGMGDEIRKTAHNLMPEVLLKQTLPEAVRSFCNHMQKAGALQVDFQCYGSFEHIAHDYKLSIYRIVQELLKNIVAHANASHALVQLVLNEQLLTVTVEDNGTGFDAAGVKNGIGLHILKTRVSSMDGHYTLESAPGKGTSVYIEFELRNITANEPV